MINKSLEMKENIGKMGNPNADKKIAEEILQYINQKQQAVN